MPVVIGAHVGPYRVLAPIGAGGMGEVYRARDTKLNRDVALKVLPALVATDPDRLARFNREAQLLAALNHPHIAQIYGLEDADDIQALVMELVEGPTLADRIAQGPIRADDALAIAKQIAEALEAAHEQGIIHRDLKPTNIKVRPDGTVKVLDFGLAKTLEAGGAGGLHSISAGGFGATNSPTITTPASTLAGVILGTAAYMSPEQAKGQPADKRSDIWAFGCVLFEMLTGKRAFEGDDVSETLAAVLKSDPDWSAVPKDVPASIRVLVRRCLQKDRTKRPGDISAPLYVIDERSLDVPDPALAIARRSVWRRLALVLPTFAGTLALTVLAWWAARPTIPVPAVTRFTVPVPEGQQFTFGAQPPVIAISPDGSQIVYALNQGLFLRSLSDSESRAIPGGEGPQAGPAFSPDGRSIAFVSTVSRPSEGGGQSLILRRIAATGGPAVTICSTCAAAVGLNWEDDGILFSERGKGVMRISASGGGTPELLVRVDDGQLARDPQMLPDKETMLFTLEQSVGADLEDKSQAVIESLRSHQRKTLLDNIGSARYVTSGHLVYTVGGVLFAVPFDSRRQVVTGERVAVIEGVRRTNPSVGLGLHLSVSKNGTAIFLPGPATPSISPQLGLALSDRSGTLDLLKVPAGSYQAPRVSPDGRRVAFHSETGKEAEISVYELAGTRAPLRITFEGRNRFPVWSPDSQRVAFQSDRDGAPGLFVQRADGAGTPERLTRADPGTEQFPESWSPGGSVLLFTVTRGSKVSLWTLSLADKKTAPYGDVESVFPINATFSPDGRWVAYAAAGSSQASSTVYVQPFPATGAKYQISKDDDGHHPVWSPDGKELSYIPGPGRLVAVAVRTQPTFSSEFPKDVPRAPFLFGGRLNERNHDILRDGQRFIGVIPASGQRVTGAAAPSIQVVLNWTEELKRLAPAK